MKLKKWFFGALMVGTLASCSSDNIADEPSAPSVGEKTSGYLALQINLPQEVQSRANADNVDFADGEAWEYGVKDAKLLLFKTSSYTSGDNGNNATFIESYTLKRAFSPSDPSNDQITASSVEAVPIDIEVTDDTYLWALVMLNVPNGVADPSENQTFSDYLKETADYDFMKTVDGKNYIFMTNAPLSANQGGGKNPTNSPTVSTLACLGKAGEAIKSTLQEARENVAGCIYVERALAKFTSTMTNPTVTIKGDPGENGETQDLGLIVDVSKSYFGLDHINKTSYVVRNVVDFPSTLTNEDPFSWSFYSAKVAPYYRMIGSINMPAFSENPLLHDQVQNLYRTYWCVDPNYETQIGDFLATAEADFKQVGKGAFYAKENTFTVANQNYGNTTLAIFKITFTKDGKASDLYILNDNHEVVYTKVEDATSNVYQYILSQDIVKNALKESVKEGVTGDFDFGSYLLIEFDIDEAGTYYATGITLNSEQDGFSDVYGSEEAALAKFKAILTSEKEADLLGRVNALYVLTKYTGGVSYYAIPIMHFGEASTPWAAADGKNQTDTREAYMDSGSKFNSKNYLGRYGMVRNNWYEIDVSSFKGLGSPVIPNYEDSKLSDDNNEVKKYIGIETHILSWAKRAQSANF